MPATPYSLAASIGSTPQVITETVYEVFYRYDGWVPGAVHIVTTTAGADAARARLLGVSGCLDHSRVPIAPTHRWAELCHDVLGIAPPPLHIEVVESGGTPLLDIRTPADDQAFADACYALVARLTGPGQPPLLGSISGGRKSMSAHMMNAFSALARQGDLLCHVLVNPPSLERNPDFFYPTDPANQKIDLIELAFPQLRPFLVKSLLDGREPSGLGDLLEAARPHLVAEQTPVSGEIVLGDRGGYVRLYDASGKEMTNVALSTGRITTFLLLADALCDHPDGMPAAVLMDEGDAAGGAEQQPTQRTREWLAARLNGSQTDVVPWTDGDRLSKTISDLNASFADEPVALRFFKAAKQGHSYAWPEPLPCTLKVRLAPVLRPAEALFEQAWRTHFPHLTYEWL